MPVAYNIPQPSFGVSAALHPNSEYDNAFIDPLISQIPFRGYVPQTRCLSKRVDCQPRTVRQSHPPKAPRKSTSISVTLHSVPLNSSVSYGNSGFNSRKLCQTPLYNSLDDPHLIDYFARKFGVIADNAEILPLKRTRSASRSRPSTGDKKRRRTKSSHNLMIDGAGIKSESPFPSKKIKYEVTVKTGDVKGASTAANVYVRLRGSNGKMRKKKKLSKGGSEDGFKFAKNSESVFKFKHVDLGELTSLSLEHDGTEKKDSWFVNEVIVKNTHTNDLWVFPCNQWFSLYEDDCQTKRILHAEKVRQRLPTDYEVVVTTGDRAGAGTNANVSIIVYGSDGYTPKLSLKRIDSKTFSRGRTDTFKVAVSQSVGEITKIRIQHDNVGFAPGWYLDKVIITDLANPGVRYYATCDAWLASDEGEGIIFRDLICSTDPTKKQTANKYIVTTETGSVRGAGTDANVFLTIFGDIGGDSGERKLNTSSNNFEKGKVDTFTIECPSLGKIERCRIRHDNANLAPSWFLESLKIEDSETRKSYSFPCHKWLSRKEGDGKIERDLYTSDRAGDVPEGVPYEVTVYTGDFRGAGTNASVYIVMHGEVEKDITGVKSMVEQNSSKIYLVGGKFERSGCDNFTVDCTASLAPLTRLTVGHDNNGVGAGWFLDRIVIFSPHRGVEQHFVCQKWLADDEGDKLIERELTERMLWRTTKKPKSTWLVEVHTSDVFNASTSATVYMQLYGDKGKSDEHILSNQSVNFQKGSIDHFKLSMQDVGIPFKLRVWHDNSGFGAGWHLNKMILKNLETDKSYVFNCNKWLADDEDYFETCRELTPHSVRDKIPLVAYKLYIYTGKAFGAGTDANVSVTLFGTKGDSGTRKVRHSEKNINKFEASTKSVEECVFECVSLGQLNKVRVEHDNKYLLSGWFLDKIEVEEVGKPGSRLCFPCYQWLDADKGDGQCCRDLVLEGTSLLDYCTEYNISVKTGDEMFAGTDANVFIHIRGSEGDTGKLFLRQSSSSKNKFERNRIDKFKLSAANVGTIERIHFGHDGSNPGSGWLVDKVEIEVPVRGECYIFSIHRWLDSDKLDKKIEIEAYPTEVVEREATIPYEMTVFVTEQSTEMCSANLYAMIYGKNGTKTKPLPLQVDSNYQKDLVYKFKFSEKEVGEIYKLRIWHDNSGSNPHWHIDKITVARSKPKPPKKSEKKSESSSRLEDSQTSFKAKKEIRFESRKVDIPLFYTFICGKWLSAERGDQSIMRELAPSATDGRYLAKYVTYNVNVKTGVFENCDITIPVYLKLSGTKGDWGERKIERHFVVGTTQSIEMEAVDLGKLLKLEVWHNSRKKSDSWFLDRIEINDDNPQNSCIFLCQQWLSATMGDRQTHRTLVEVDSGILHEKEKLGDPNSLLKLMALEMRAQKTTYRITFFTGTVRNAGTDANVYIELNGEKDSSKRFWMCNSMTHTKAFASGNQDTFIVEAKDLGQLTSILVGHDDSGGGSGWYLDKVTVDAPAEGQSNVFPCGRWLDRDEDDGSIQRVLEPLKTQADYYDKHVPYEVTTVTSDQSNAGTEADVFIAIYGEDSCTNETSLASSKLERKQSFKRGQTSQFIVDMLDIASSIKKIRIGHSNRNGGAGWHLSSVTVRKLIDYADISKGSIIYKFDCNRWLDYKEDDQSIVRELVPSAVLQESLDQNGHLRQENVQISTLDHRAYKVLVYTGKVNGAGTDANVFLTIYGENGDSGERKLARSETHRDKFEKNNCDIFTVNAVDLSKLTKVRVRHDNSGFKSAAWFLDRIEIEDDTKEVTTFRCERWLAKNKDDGKIERSLYAEGYEGDTASITTARSFGSMRSLNSSRDYKFGDSPRRKMTHMPVFEGPTIKYNLKITTGQQNDMGTNAAVFVNVFGADNKSTGQLPIEPLERNGFRPQSIEKISFEAPDIGELLKVEISHDGVLSNQGWFLQELELDVPSKGKIWRFPCNRWLAKDKEDGYIQRTLSIHDASVSTYQPCIPYELTTQTANESLAGTDGSIIIEVFGLNGKTIPYRVDKIDDRFERGHDDTIRIELKDVEPLRMMRVTLDGKHVTRDEWKFKEIHLRNMKTLENTIFKENKDFSSISLKYQPSIDLAAFDYNSPQISRTNYNIKVKTSDKFLAGTDSNVFVVLFGENGESSTLALKNSKTHINKFERNHVDEFEFLDVLSLGQLYKCRVWHDDKNLSSSWHLEFVEVFDTTTRKAYKFYFNKWLSSSKEEKQLIREVTCINLQDDIQSGDIDYKITVKTADQKDANTSYHGYIKLIGSRQSSPYLFMTNKRKRSFIRGETNNFKFTTVNVGNIEAILLGHIDRTPDSENAAAGDDRPMRWICNYVIVDVVNLGDRYTFTVNKSLPLSSNTDTSMRFERTKVEYGRLTTAKNLQQVTYLINVFTGHERGAGTDANVYITLYGLHGDTGMRQLTKSFRDLFERGRSDDFLIECLDLGQLQGISVNHDNSGTNPGWLLDRIEVTNMTTKDLTVFPCNVWLDKMKGDRQTSRYLVPIK